MLKAGFIGFGRMGITHFSILNSHHSVKIVEVCDFDDRGCRTQVVTEVDDARALFANWGGAGEGFFGRVHAVKWPLTAAAAASVCALHAQFAKGLTLVPRPLLWHVV